MSEVNFKMAVDNCTDKSSELINSDDLEKGLLWASERIAGLEEDVASSKEVMKLMPNELELQKRIAELEDTITFQNSEMKRKAVDSKARIEELEKEKSIIELQRGVEIGKFTSDAMDMKFEIKNLKANIEGLHHNLRVIHSELSTISGGDLTSLDYESLQTAIEFAE